MSVVLGTVVLALTPVVMYGLWRGAAWGSHADCVAPVWLAVLGIPGWSALGLWLYGVEDAFAAAATLVFAFIAFATLGAVVGAVRFRRSA